MWFSLFLSLLVAGLLFLTVPKGSIAHELLHLPPFWARMMQAARPLNKPVYHTYGEHHRQYFLFFEPEVYPPKALIVYFHGGGWRFGRPEAFQPNARVFLDEGYAVVLPSVRRIPRFSFPDMEQDLIRILDEINQLKRQKGWEKLPLIVGGMSSGGHLAAQVVLNEDIRHAGGLQDGDLAGAFFCGAPLNLDPLSWSPVIRLMAGSPKKPEFRRANPIEHLPPPPKTPFLIIHGTHDGLVPEGSAHTFVESREYDAALHCHYLPYGTHLDASSWGYADNKLRQRLIEWLNGLDT